MVVFAYKPLASRGCSPDLHLLSRKRSYFTNLKCCFTYIRETNVFCERIWGAAQMYHLPCYLCSMDDEFLLKKQNGYTGMTSSIGHNPTLDFQASPYCCKFFATNHYKHPKISLMDPFIHSSDNSFFQNLVQKATTEVMVCRTVCHVTVEQRPILAEHCAVCLKLPIISAWNT